MLFEIQWLFSFILMMELCCIGTQLEAENEVNNEMANRMSLFYAEATPMLKTLSNATTKFVSEVDSLSWQSTPSWCGYYREWELHELRWSLDLLSWRWSEEGIGWTPKKLITFGTFRSAFPKDDSAIINLVCDQSVEDFNQTCSSLCCTHQL